MSVGRGLLKALITNRAGLSALTERRIDENYFNSDERPAYHFLLTHYLNYRVMPSLDTLCSELDIPEFFVGIPDEPVAYWVEELVRRDRFNRLVSGFERINNIFDQDHINDTVDELGRLFSDVRLSASENRVKTLKELQRSVLDMHDAMQRGARLPGIPFGIPYLDGISGGACPGDLVTICGRPAVGKSWFMLLLAITAAAAGHRVLFASPEMPEMQIARRALSIETFVRANDLKFGRLSYFGRERIEQYISGKSDDDNFFVVPSGLTQKVDDLEILVREYHPDITIVDGAYLLTLAGRGYGHKKWEKTMGVFERLKEITLRENQPVIAGVQLNRDKEVGYSDAIEQLSSLMMNIEYERREDAGSTAPIQRRILKITKGRDGECGSVLLQFNMLHTNITQERVLSGNFSAFEQEELDRFFPEEDDSDDNAFSNL